jgi:protein-disulfide isomerase
MNSSISLSDWENKKIMCRMNKKPTQLPNLFVLAVIFTASILACQLSSSPATPTNPSTRTPRPTPTIKINIPKPSDFPLPNGRQLGEASAPVTVEVFSDFQCPACRLYATTVEPKIIQQYVPDGKVLYIYHHYPFIGQESVQAANASMCAAEQNHFWEYHDLLFANQNGENQGAFSDDMLLASAKADGLNIITFSACFDQKRYQPDIDQDLATGESKGVSAVPSVFVNGTAITPGAMPGIKDLQKAIDEALGQP